eukprot:TRINITY_DN1695_c0_g1_i1.p1 TRINITY_DN1695_c0_g1~~TRINITY_DN1695_c0_g1_i1.p1  ORF type:complete len:663 (-),score=188.44 TRINITY_DN1695_c0_g1_i1:3541-5529(-)
MKTVAIFDKADEDFANVVAELYGTHKKYTLEEFRSATTIPGQVVFCISEEGSVITEDTTGNSSQSSSSDSHIESDKYKETKEDDRPNVVKFMESFRQEHMDLPILCVSTEGSVASMVTPLVDSFVYVGGIGQMTMEVILKQQKELMEVLYDKGEHIMVLLRKRKFSSLEFNKMEKQQQQLQSKILFLESQLVGCNCGNEESIKSARRKSLNDQSMFDTPMDDILDLLSVIKNAKNQNADSSRAVETLLNALTESHIHEPDLQRLFEYTGLDDDTREWLTSEFSNQDTPVKVAGKRWLERTRSISELKHTKQSAGYVSSTLVQGLQRLDFDIFKVQDDAVVPHLFEMFNDFGILEAFGIEAETMINFIIKIRDKYQENPYHNFLHAFDVTQTVYAFICNTHAKDFLTTQDCFALLIAALGHDVGHPGLTNDFHVRAQTDLAIIYNDLSPLESFHCSTLFVIAQQEDSNIFSGLDTEAFVGLRKMIIECILGTDMVHHFTHVSQFRLVTKAFNQDDREHILEVCKTMLHAADISNPTKPWRVAKKWTQSLADEFRNQGKVEKSKGMLVGPMNSETNDENQMTINFIKFIVTPMFEALVTFFPGLQPLLKRMNKNLAKLKLLMGSVDEVADSEDEEDTEATESESASVSASVSASNDTLNVEQVE